jgi:hypothetical protein
MSTLGPNPRASRTRRRAAVLAALALAAAGPGAGPAAAAAFDRTHTGPPPATRTLELREAWRAGGADDTGVLLGKVGRAISGPGGEVFVLDSQLAEVQVFGPDGTHRRTLGRAGAGPGEFRQPVGLFLTDDGRLGVQQPFPGRVTSLDPADGTPLGTWQTGQDDPAAGGFAFLGAARARGGTFAIAGTRTNFDPAAQEIAETRFLALIGPDGQRTATLAERQTTRSLVAFTIDELASHDPGARDLWDVGPGGRVVTVPRYDAYALVLHDASGATVGKLQRADYQARRRTEQEKQEQRDSVAMNFNGQEPRISWKLQDRARCIDRVRILDDGRLWVRHSRSADHWDDHGRMVYDVFGPDGAWLGATTVSVPGGGAGDRLLLLDDGRFLLIKGLESLSISVTAGDSEHVTATQEPLGDTLLELVCYEVVP